MPYILCHTNLFQKTFNSSFWKRKRVSLFLGTCNLWSGILFFTLMSWNVKTKTLLEFSSYLKLYQSLKIPSFVWRLWFYTSFWLLLTPHKCFYEFGHLISSKNHHKHNCYSCFADELEKAKSEYNKVKEELDTTMQELNEMWESWTGPCWTFIDTILFSL